MIYMIFLNKITCLYKTKLQVIYRENINFIILGVGVIAWAGISNSS